MTTTAIKERPILFSGPMVQAIISGKKTQTRRVLKLPSWSHPNDGGEDIAGTEPMVCAAETGCLARIPCPYGAPGDRLWVRECHYQSGFNFRVHPGDDEYRGWSTSARYDKTQLYYTTDGIPPCRGDGEWGPQADNQERAARGSRFFPDSGKNFWRKFPSIHMPRWASRITLEITGVRVERLNEISEADAKAEGSDCMRQSDGGCWVVCGPRIGSYREGYRWLWESINGPGSWDANPYVWVVEFKLVEASNG